MAEAATDASRAWATTATSIIRPPGALTHHPHLGGLKHRHHAADSFLFLLARSTLLVHRLDPGRVNVQLATVA